MDHVHTRDFLQQMPLFSANPVPHFDETTLGELARVIASNKFRVVSILGVKRKGKSTLLSFLADGKYTQRFVSKDSENPVTQGTMCSFSPETNTLYVDVQGTGESPKMEEYDVKLSSMIMTMSSAVIYFHESHPVADTCKYLVQAVINTKAKFPHVLDELLFMWCYKNTDTFFSNKSRAKFDKDGTLQIVSGSDPRVAKLLRQFPHFTTVHLHHPLKSKGVMTPEDHHNLFRDHEESSPLFWQDIDIIQMNLRKTREFTFAEFVGLCKAWEVGFGSNVKLFRTLEEYMQKWEDDMCAQYKTNMEKLHFPVESSSFDAAHTKAAGDSEESLKHALNVCLDEVEQARKTEAWKTSRIEPLKEEFTKRNEDASTSQCTTIIDTELAFIEEAVSIVFKFKKYNETFGSLTLRFVKPTIENFSTNGKGVQREAQLKLLKGKLLAMARRIEDRYNDRKWDTSDKDDVYNFLKIEEE